MLSTTLLGCFYLWSILSYNNRLLLFSFSILCNTILLISATILASLLTLLMANSGLKSKLDNRQYFEVLNIAKVDSFIFVLALVLFKYIPWWLDTNTPFIYLNTTLYWSGLLLSSLLSGFMVFVIITLHNTLSNIIKIELNKKTIGIRKGVKVFSKKHPAKDL